MKQFILSLAVCLLAVAAQAQLIGCGTCNKDGMKWCFYNVGPTTIAKQEPCGSDPVVVSRLVPDSKPVTLTASVKSDTVKYSLQNPLADPRRKRATTRI
jgi:hypothetical protein